MKKIILVITFMSILAPAVVYAHGGGCRKADKPQCCHMDNSTGTVHCH